MERIESIAAALQERAWQVVKESNVMATWSSVGAVVNLIGSLKTGLMIRNRDIDLHIYTDPFSLSDSFLAVSRLAENPRIRRVSYTNLLDAEDRCIEWHAGYEDDCGESWQIDMIHIRMDSRYAGHFEKVADRISAVLSDETRRAILSIKYALPPDRKVPGIQVCRAVIEGGVRDERSFWEWREHQPQTGIDLWMP